MLLFGNGFSVDAFAFVFFSVSMSDSLVALRPRADARASACQFSLRSSNGQDEDWRHAILDALLDQEHQLPDTFDLVRFGELMRNDARHKDVGFNV